MHTGNKLKRSRGRSTASAQAISIHRTTRNGMVVRNYDELIAALRQRRIDLGMTQEQVNHKAGFQDGYVNKLELGYRDGGRGLGAMSLPTLLDTLGVCLIVSPVGEEKAAPLCVEEGR